MQQPIIGFHQDEHGDWVADLACGHGQHVRHQPPLTMRPWVLSEAGRREHLGEELNCKKCDEGGQLNRLAFSATVHCLSGCAIGEVLGMAIGTALGWGNWPTIALAIVLAFLFGYSLTLLPLLRGRIALGHALKLAFAADTASITIMEIVDNAIMLLVPGAMDADLADPLFWGSLLLSLLLAGVAAFPANRWLIARGRGHAVVHAHHGAHPPPA